ncbi:MAG: site-specific DNA-methyltransferase [Eubacteriales bacterium]
MKIIFDGKESKEDIVLRFKNAEKSLPFIDHSFVVEGDNLEVMSSMLNEYRGKIDLVYIDPPFNTNQEFSVTDTRASTISRPKNGEIAYSDEMTKDEFINFMYRCFVLIYELLSEEGSLYVHIDLKMGHYFKVILDEIFGESSFKNDITRIKSNPKNFDRRAYGNHKDMILLYTKSSKNIWNNIKIKCDDEELAKRFTKIDKNGRRYTTIPLHAPGESSSTSPTGMPWRNMNPPEGRHWRTNPTEFDKLDSIGLIEWSSKGNPRIIKYADEHKGKKIQDIWNFKDPQYPLYPTQKNLDMLDLIVKQSSKSDSIVLDCFAGSGTTLLAAKNNGRKYIGIDNSNIAMKVIKKRIPDVSIIDFNSFE